MAANRKIIDNIFSCIFSGGGGGGYIVMLLLFFFYNQI